MNEPDPKPEPIHPPAEQPDTYKELDFSGKEHQLLSCPKCNHFISGADINIEKTIARCSHCQHVFGFSHDSASGLLKPELIIPQGIEVLKLRSEMDMRLDWSKTASSGGRKFMLLFTFLWNIILLPFVLSIVLSGSWGLLLFISLHLAVGLGLIWYLAAMYLNKTSISLNKQIMRVRTMPVPLPLHKAKEIELGQIDQMYVSRYTESTSNGVPNYAFALYALMKDGEKVSLLRGMNKETQQYIEQEIEGYLGIPNKRISEETA